VRRDTLKDATAKSQIVRRSIANVSNKESCAQIFASVKYAKIQKNQDHQLLKIFSLFRKCPRKKTEFHSAKILHISIRLFQTKIIAVKIAIAVATISTQTTRTTTTEQDESSLIISY